MLSNYNILLYNSNENINNQQKRSWKNESISKCIQKFPAELICG